MNLNVWRRSHVVHLYLKSMVKIQTLNKTCNNPQSFRGYRFVSGQARVWIQSRDHSPPKSHLGGDQQWGWCPPLPTLKSSTAHRGHFSVKRTFTCVSQVKQREREHRHQTRPSNRKQSGASAAAAANENDSSSFLFPPDSEVKKEQLEAVQ